MEGDVTPRTIKFAGDWSRCAGSDVKEGFVLSLVRSLWEVFRHAFARRVSVQYREEKPYLAPRYRGRIVLTKDPDGGERCVACNLCAVACPVDCISLQATEDEHGRRYPEFFRINFSRCIFCGYCDARCPHLCDSADTGLRDGRVQAKKSRVRERGPHD